MAVDYLLKPVDQGDLGEAIDKALDRRTAPQHDLFRQLHHTLQSPNAVLNKIALPVELGYIMVDIPTILYCEASSNYAKVYLDGEVVHLLSRPLKYLDDLLHDQGFFRIHQSWLINTQHMIKYTRTDGGMVEMANSMMIPVSKSRKPAFEHFINGYRV
jgi:two-component system LytT family response regulator